MSATLTWVGHATVLMDFPECRVLTDPTLKRRVAHLRRRTPVPHQSIAEVDLVLISHVHMDHLHLPSLERVDGSVPLVVPRGAAGLLTGRGFDQVHEVVPGDRLEVAGVEIEAVPAEHFCGRGPHSRVRAEPIGYLIGNGKYRIYFAGDTDLHAGMADLPAIDAAFLPIWGWGPTIGEGHMDPERAAEATRLIKPEIVIPMHWGTYAPENARPGPPTWMDDAIRRFSKLLTDTPEERRLEVLEPGQAISLP